MNQFTSCSALEPTLPSVLEGAGHWFEPIAASPVPSPMQSYMSGPSNHFRGPNNINNGRHNPGPFEEPCCSPEPQALAVMLVAGMEEPPAMYQPTMLITERQRLISDIQNLTVAEKAHVIEIIRSFDPPQDHPVRQTSHGYMVAEVGLHTLQHGTLWKMRCFVSDRLRLHRQRDHLRFPLRPTTSAPILPAMNAAPSPSLQCRPSSSNYNSPSSMRRRICESCKTTE